MGLGIHLLVKSQVKKSPAMPGYFIVNAQVESGLYVCAGIGVERVAEKHVLRIQFPADVAE